MTRVNPTVPIACFTQLSEIIHFHIQDLKLTKPQQHLQVHNFKVAQIYFKQHKTLNKVNHNRKC